MPQLSPSKEPRHDPACARLHCIPCFRRLYELASEKQQQQAAAQAADALRRRRQLRNRHDALMRKPWQRPASPRNAIPKRGGLRRQRSALARSCEHTPPMPQRRPVSRAGGERHRAANAPGIRTFIRQQRRQRHTAGDAAPTAFESHLTWCDVKVPAARAKAVSARPTDGRTVTPLRDEGRACSSGALSRCPSMRDLVHVSVPTQRCCSAQPTDAELCSASAGAPQLSRCTLDSLRSRRASVPPVDSHATCQSCDDAQTAADVPVGVDQLGPVYSRPASLPRHRALPRKLNISPPASPTPSAAPSSATAEQQQQAFDCAAPVMQPPPMAYGLSFASLVASTAEWPQVGMRSALERTVVPDATHCSTAQMRPASAVSPRPSSRSLEQESSAGQPRTSAAQQLCSQAGKDRCPNSGSVVKPSSMADAARRVACAALLQDTVQLCSHEPGVKSVLEVDRHAIDHAGPADAAEGCVLSSCTASGKQWVQTSNQSVADTCGFDAAEPVSPQGSSRDNSWHIAAYAPRRVAAGWNADLARESTSQGALPPCLQASGYDPLAAILASSTSQLHSLSSAGRLPWPEAAPAAPWQSWQQFSHNQPLGATATRRSEGGFATEHLSLQPRPHSAASARGPHAEPLQRPAVGRPELGTLVCRLGTSAGDQLSPWIVDTNHVSVDGAAKGGALQHDVPARPSNITTSVTTPHGDLSAAGGVHALATTVRCADANAAVRNVPVRPPSPGPVAKPAPPASASERVQDMFADVRLLEQLRQRMRAELCALRSSCGHDEHSGGGRSSASTRASFAQDTHDARQSAGSRGRVHRERDAHSPQPRATVEPGSQHDESPSQRDDVGGVQHSDCVVAPDGAQATPEAIELSAAQQARRYDAVTCQQVCGNGPVCCAIVCVACRL